MESYVDGGTLICFYTDGNYNQAITEALKQHGLERGEVQVVCKPEPDMIDRLMRKTLTIEDSNEIKMSGAKLGDGSFFDEVDDESFNKSVEVTLQHLQLVIAFATNDRNIDALMAMQKCCQKLFKEASETLDRGAYYGIEPGD